MFFDSEDFDDHEQVVFASDAASGLRAIIAVHNTQPGPAVGGCRILPYTDDQAALTDALRLSRGMTLKNVMAGLPLGGGKAVIIADPAREKSPALLRAMGRAVGRLGGVYITAEDVGTGPEDMIEIRKATRHVAGLPVSAGGTGDPSPSTALGCFEGIRAALRYRDGRNSLQGVRVAIQGLGHVGTHLAALLTEAGARLTVADVNPGNVERAARLGADVVEPEAIYDVEADIFAPCALGAVINDETLPRLKVHIVAGAANNQLATPAHGAALRQRDILYAPDYVINAGGIIQVGSEIIGEGRDLVEARIRGIGDTLLGIFTTAQAEGVPTSEAADRMAIRRLKNGQKASAA